MRAGVYVDGYNLYYSGRQRCGPGTAGWRWLDVRKFATEMIATRRDWGGAAVARITYCTAQVDATTNPSAHADQDVYLKASKATGSVDWIEYGHYVARGKTGLVATKDPATGRPVIHTSRWPVMVQGSSGQDVPSSRFMTSYLHWRRRAATST